MPLPPPCPFAGDVHGDRAIDADAGSVLLPATAHVDVTADRSGASSRGERRFAGDQGEERVKDAQQLMHESNVGLTAFAAGDVSGFAVLRATARCQPTL